MYSFPSRAERRMSMLCSSSEKGEFSVKGLVLYSAEIKKLRKEGFEVQITDTFKTKNALFVADVDWSNAYHNIIPHLVFSYIHGIIETFPKSQVENLAQELYVVSQRINNKK